jgi:CcmD family protein
MMIRNLAIAYIATWVIHLGYLALLTVKGARLRRELRELQGQKK